MIIRFTRTIALPSGNEARNFRFHSLGYGRVQATYEYTDRRRNHQTARRFTVEFMNGRVESITARSAPHRHEKASPARAVGCVQRIGRQSLSLVSMVPTRAKLERLSKSIKQS